METGIPIGIFEIWTRRK